MQYKRLISDNYRLFNRDEFYFHLKESKEMSDKKILKESTIRKMMKLANIPALSDKFIQENYYTYNEQEEIEAEEEELDPAP